MSHHGVTGQQLMSLIVIEHPGLNIHTPGIAYQSHYTTRIIQQLVSPSVIEQQGSNIHTLGMTYHSHYTTRILQQLISVIVI